LTIREGVNIEEGITDAIQLNANRKACGFDQQALEDAARLGFGNAAFEFSEDEIPDVLEEFYSETEQGYSTCRTCQTYVDVQAEFERQAGP